MTYDKRPKLEIQTNCAICDCSAGSRFYRWDGALLPRRRREVQVGIRADRPEGGRVGKGDQPLKTPQRLRVEGGSQPVAEVEAAPAALTPDG